MRFLEGNLSWSYDEHFDILYISAKGRDYSYGEDQDNGIVVFRSIETGAFTGYIIYDFIKNYDTKQLDLTVLDEEYRKLAEKLAEKFK